MAPHAAPTPGSPRSSPWRVLAVVATVLVVALAVTVVVLAMAGGDGDQAETSRQPTSTEQGSVDVDHPVEGRETPTRSTSRTAASGELVGNPPTPSWIVVTASLPKATVTFGEAVGRARAARAAGIDAFVIDSDDYQLSPGYWVVYTGTWSDSAGASEYCASIKGGAVPDCYVRDLAR